MDGTPANQTKLSLKWSDTTSNRKDFVLQRLENTLDMTL